MLASSLSCEYGKSTLPLRIDIIGAEASVFSFRQSPVVDSSYTSKRKRFATKSSKSVEKCNQIQR